MSFCCNMNECESHFNNIDNKKLMKKFKTFLLFLLVALMTANLGILLSDPKNQSISKINPSLIETRFINCRRCFFGPVLARVVDRNGTSSNITIFKSHIPKLSHQQPVNDKPIRGDQP